jgi:hypothetical protein
MRVARGDRGAVAWRAPAARPVVVGVGVVAGLVAAGMVVVVVGVAEVVVVAACVAAGVRACAGVVVLE